jgi:hypothetical protein
MLLERDVDAPREGERFAGVDDILGGGNCGVEQDDEQPNR